MNSLRMLRVWHWRQALHHRDRAKLARAYIDPGKQGERIAASCLDENIANFHVRAVQLLNDCPDCLHTTAEQDNEELS